MHLFLSTTPAEARIVRESFNQNRGRVLLGNVGRIVSHKKIYFILDALVVRGGLSVPAAFVVVGRMEDDRCLEMFQQKGELDLESCVVHIGERADVAAVMKSFDIFAGPALEEGFGLVVAEAQAAGIACVLSTGFPRDIDMGLGLVTFVDGYDADEWARAIVPTRGHRQLEPQNIRDEFARRGFDAKGNALLIERLYRSSKLAILATTRTAPRPQETPT